MSKTIKYWLLFFSIHTISFAQNLVPNYSFEQNSSCPNNSSQLQHALPWQSPSNNDGDYYNSCSTNSIYSVPWQGVYNFQYAHSGSAFVGIFLYDGPNNNYREYAQVQLQNQLLAGSCYYVEFYVNLPSGNIGGKYASNNIAAHLSGIAYSSSSTQWSNNVLSLNPDIMVYGNPVIKDTLNWVKIAGIYTATGSEQYIIIGNFFNDSLTDTISYAGGSYPGSYYFIDDVSVISVDSINLPANAGPDTTIAAGDSVFVGQTVSHLNCNWYDGTNLIASNVPGVFVKPAITTTYVVEQNLCGKISYDTVKVNVSPLGIELNKQPTNVFIYPNPTDNVLNISFLNQDKINVFVTNVMGDLLISFSTEKKDNTIDLTNLSNGVYFIRLVSNKYNFRKKIIIEHR